MIRSIPSCVVDERPCMLIEDIGGILPMRPRGKRYHHEYGRNGTCCVLLIFEPHTGLRYVEVRPQRKPVDYAEFMHTVARVYYPEAVQLRIVQDQLNTHTPGSFYSVLAPEQAFALAQRFDMHYTPVKGSWLNMAEIELAALVKQCLDRRLPTLNQLRREVLVWADRRNLEGQTVEWSFAATDACIKMKRHYGNVCKLM